ncbi:MAG: flagellar FliJ family protein, partial [Betaproteobacteria bacterium]|nr:flagellar FliJ family protein [Betaproteobacteria bacterium]
MSDSSSHSQRIQTLRNLHEQAQRAGQELAVRLRRAQAEQAQAENKLRSLDQFAAQYRQQLGDVERRGGAWSQVRDLRSFLDRLAAAQAQQRTEIERAHANCAEHLRAWTAARQKEKAF